MLACLTLLVRNRRSALRTSTWAGSTPHTQLQLQFFSPPTTTLFSSYPVPHPWEGDGGAGAPVLLEHRVSPGARLLTLVGHYGVLRERSELCTIHYPYLPDNQRQVMPVEGPSQVERRGQEART